MPYVLGMLGLCLALLLLQRYAPAKWQPRVQFWGVILTLSTFYVLMTHPYRVARVLYDLAHLF